MIYIYIYTNNLLIRCAPLNLRGPADYLRADFCNVPDSAYTCVTPPPDPTSLIYAYIYIYTYILIPCGLKPK